MKVGGLIFKREEDKNVLAGILNFEFELFWKHVLVDGRIENFLELFCQRGAKFGMKMNCIIKS